MVFSRENIDTPFTQEEYDELIPLMEPFSGHAYLDRTHQSVYKDIEGPVMFFRLMRTLDMITAATKKGVFIYINRAGDVYSVITGPGKGNPISVKKIATVKDTEELVKVIKDYELLFISFYRLTGELMESMS